MISRGLSFQPTPLLKSGRPILRRVYPSGPTLRRRNFNESNLRLPIETKDLRGESLEINVVLSQKNLGDLVQFPGSGSFFHQRSDKFSARIELKNLILHVLDKEGPIRSDFDVPDFPKIETFAGILDPHRFFQGHDASGLQIEGLGRIDDHIFGKRCSADKDGIGKNDRCECFHLNLPLLSDIKIPNRSQTGFF
jgi:hypothetical protein